MLKLTILALSALLFMGCSMTKEVKPWEKGNLAKPIMQFEGLHPLVAKFDAHVYFSKEAARGGNGVAGGGCGCN
ncbi:MAG: Unknown protein [uncultured Sulfurovum sp.]|uniref:DUF4266 domain-containing protein n=1 Tax=uncultured Sulfurovum sp. TaxID=269237 RepID=A0A6S6T4T1_9BACT|nr:MAG: Unknown protein [uncultured Sulfurovum sp.]